MHHPAQEHRTQIDSIEIKLAEGLAGQSMVAKAAARAG